MNVFVLHTDPTLCAQMHADKHVVKMIVETAQLLCTVHHLKGSNRDYMYRKTHVNHPCSKWARESVQNYKWLCRLGLELCREYTYRYGKIHKTQRVLERLALDIPNLPDSELTAWALAMPIECKVENDAVESYRRYYVMEKQRLAKWKNRNVPTWFSN